MSITYTLGDFRSTPKMKELVNQVLDSGRLSYGELCAQVESNFALRHQRIFGVLCNSGTSALQLALQTLKELHGWKDGDEVIVPAITFVATVNIVLHCRLKPVVVDVNPVYYDLNPDLIESKITDRTRCIIPVHMFGQPADMPRIAAIARKHDLLIIEDSCEAMGVSIDGTSVGAWGDIACFSTYVAHIITSGVGGIAITNDPGYESHMRSLANHGIALDSLPTGETLDPTFLGRNFTFDKVGHSFRVTEMEAALLLPQIDDLDNIIAKRRRIALLLSKFFEQFNDELALPETRSNAEHSWMVYPILMRHEKADTLIKHLRSCRIEIRQMMPLVSQPCYKFLPFLYPVAQRINEYGFYIGCHQHLTQEQTGHLMTSVYKWFKGNVDTHLKDVLFEMKGA